MIENFLYIDLGSLSALGAVIIGAITGWIIFQICYKKNLKDSNYQIVTIT